MKTLTQIRTRDWSLALDGVVDGSGLGDVVENLTDIDQCLRIILTTTKGTDPLRPDFACNLLGFLDHPVEQVRPQIVLEVTEAIFRYEPRVKVLSVTVDLVAIAQLLVGVTWQPLIAGLVPSASFQTVITIGV